jgi:hypothetical protein
MLYLVARTAQSPEELTQPVRRAVESVDEAVSLRRMRTFETQLPVRIRAVDPLAPSIAAMVWVAVTCLACIPPIWRSVRNAAAAIRELG